MRVKGKFAHAVILGWIVLLLSACGGGGSPPPPPPVLQSIAVAPTNQSLKLNRSLQLTATGSFSNGSSADMTATVVWTSSDSNQVAVSASGRVTAGTSGAPGLSATITATSGAISGNTSVTLVTAAFSASGVNDPLATQQWHLVNTGQNAYADNSGTAGFDVNVGPVYNGPGWTGLNVRVAVVDTGLEIAHEDLAPNVVPNGSWDFDGGDTDPTNSFDTDGDHGTSVAGLIASVKENGAGGIGVAPEAKLKGFNPLQTQLGADFAASLGGSTANPNSSDVAIFNQSFGLSGQGPIARDPIFWNQLIAGTTSLRDGKGALYVKAAGNGFNSMGILGNPNCSRANPLGVSCENANFDPDNTLPYNIVVGALNASGIKSSYSTAGSALWVSAPGGEFGRTNPPTAGGFPAIVYEPAMVTTDQSGCTQGYARSAATTSQFNTGAAPNNNCNYTNTFNGTSSATPVAAGVIALLLDANPELTWRDVKHIFASSARQVDAGRGPVIAVLSNGNYTAETGWFTNAAGFNFHNWYGFGLVDAAAAVVQANPATYTLLPPPANSNTYTSGSLSLTIPNNSTTGATHTLNLQNPPLTALPGTVEAVEIKVSITHSFTGDLGIELTSPSGTRSILKNIRDGFTTADLNGMYLLSNAFYGESSAGNWTLKVVDGDNGSNTTGGTLTNWTIAIYGR